MHLHYDLSYSRSLRGCDRSEKGGINNQPDRITADALRAALNVQSSSTYSVVRLQTFFQRANLCLASKSSLSSIGHCLSSTTGPGAWLLMHSATSFGDGQVSTDRVNAAHAAAHAAHAVHATGVISSFVDES